MPTKSPDYDRFMHSFDGPITSRAEHASFDLGALARLDGDELTTVRDAIIERLDSGNEDPRVVSALLEIGDPESRTALQAGLKNAAGMTRVTIAHALARLEGHRGASEAIRSVSKLAAPSIRMAAARAAADIQDPALNDWLLLRMVEDSDAKVRTAAKMSLYQRTGLTPLPEHYGSQYFSVAISPSQEFLGLRKAAAADLAGWLERLGSGDTPEMIGLTNKPVVDMDKLEGFWALASASDSPETRASVSQLLANSNPAELLWASDYLAGFVGRKRATWAAYGLGLIQHPRAELARTEARGLNDPQIDAALDQAVSNHG